MKKLIDEVGGLEKIMEMKEQMQALERLKREKEMSFSQKREVFVESEIKVDISGPHITNINEDHQLSGRVFYNFEKLPLAVGRRNANPPNDIVLSSSSVSIKHCIFDRNKKIE